MKGKVLKLLSIFIFPVIFCLALGIFLAGGFSSGYASALMQNGGFSFVYGNSTMKVGDGTAISKFSAVNGGGVYVSSGGTLVMSGGTLFNNTASSGNGHNIYNAGVFTMNGGIVGTSQGTQTGYGIFNTGTMNLFGGTIYDDIYSENSINMKMNAHVEGTITITDSSIITISDYAGTTPSLNIVVSKERQDGLILKLSGSSSAPDMSKINITGFNGALHYVRCIKSLTEDDTFEIELVAKVTLKILKGSGIATVSGAGSYEKGSSVTINMTSITGYGANGYYLEKDGEIFCETSLSTATISLNESMILTAFAKPNIYIIHFSPNGGSGSMLDMRCEFGKSYSLSANKYSRDGYSFTNWKDKNGTTYSNGQTISNLSLINNDEIWLYAQWTANKIKITLISKNDIQSNNNYVQGYIYYIYDTNAYYSDEALSKQITNISLPTISPTYYEFGGYKDESSGSFYVDSSGNIINNLYKKVYENKDFSADWSGVVLTVKFEPSAAVYPFDNGYTDGTSYIYYRYGKENLFYTSNNCMTEINYIQLPTSINGDKCLGFYTKSGDTLESTAYINGAGDIQKSLLSNYILNNIDSIIKNNKTLTLYPKWGPKYSITFNMSNGGTCIVSQKQTYNITVGELPTPVRPGYAFVGWFTEKTDGTKVTKTTKLTSTNVTYYAHWQEMNVAFLNGLDESGKCRYVYYGFYPQSEKYSAVTVDTSRANEYGYYKGNDGNYYHLYGGTYYLCEPILWLVDYSSRSLNYEYAMTTVGILDVHDYSKSSNSWLNDDFVSKIYTPDFDGTYIKSSKGGELLSYTDYNGDNAYKFYESFGIKRSPSEYAYAKGGENSNYWWSNNDSYGFGAFAVNGPNPVDKYSNVIGINVNSNDEYGIVPIIYVSVNDCTSSSHTYRTTYGSWVNNGNLTHSRIVTKTCTSCGEIVSEKEEGDCSGSVTLSSSWTYFNPQEHRVQTFLSCDTCNTTSSNGYFYSDHSGTPTYNTSYTSDNDSTHSRNGSQYCSGCKGIFTVTDTQSHNKTNSTNYDYVSNGPSGHSYSFKQTCSDCGWSKILTGTAAHKMVDIECLQCGYSPFGLVSFTRSYHCDDDDCLSRIILCSDILIDDKKKYSSEIPFDEKRYVNDLIQLPAIGT